MSHSAEDIARLLLEYGAVTLSPEQPYRFSSGLLSPIYCDNRLLLGKVAARRTIVDAMSQMIEREILNSEVIAGTATAGIAWAAWVAETLLLPMAYVRSSAKAHGRGQQVEGGVEAAQRVVLIEDLVSKGGSALDAVAGLRQAEAYVADCCAIFTYGMADTQARFSAAGIHLHSLTDLATLLDVAEADDYLQAEQRELVERWADNPEAWGASGAED